MARRRRAASSGRDYPRTARVNELLREIIADALEEVAGERLEFVAITGVRATEDIRQATVFFDTREGEAQDEEAIELLGEVRIKLQSIINRESRIRRTPQLTFVPDPAVRGGERIDEIVRGLDHDGDD